MNVRYSDRNLIESICSPNGIHTAILGLLCHETGRIG